MTIAFQYILCCGSTNGMQALLIKMSEFQYILCCGSTEKGIKIPITLENFNTSYVVVQLFCIILLKKEGGISIHLMLWFN